MNINTELFRRTSPSKKEEIVKALTTDELMCITQDTIIRILKEVGTGSSVKSRSHNKYLNLEKKVSNDWNADIVDFSYYRKSLFVHFYLQYDNTDTHTGASYADFVRYQDYHGSYEYEDRYGGHQTAYFTFGREQKAEAYRSLALTYIHEKYKKE